MRDKSGRTGAGKGKQQQFQLLLPCPPAVLSSQQPAYREAVPGQPSVAESPTASLSWLLPLLAVGLYCWHKCRQCFSVLGFPPPFLAHLGSPRSEEKYPFPEPGLLFY
uniref:Uncharacterized protein n=1 Tax=Sphaerodactylus townsendi TaxID=933632 RepID=A0ACB8GDA7_9SAUR